VADGTLVISNSVRDFKLFVLALPDWQGFFFQDAKLLAQNFLSE
jgi:hypothetical protein